MVSGSTVVTFTKGPCSRTAENWRIRSDSGSCQKSGSAITCGSTVCMIAFLLDRGVRLDLAAERVVPQPQEPARWNIQMPVAWGGTWAWGDS